MPTIYTDNPSEFRSQMDGLFNQMESAFRQIIKDRETSGVHVCSKCGTSAKISEMRRGAGEAILCPTCLESMAYCQLSNVYHPADQVKTYYDGGNESLHARPLTLSQAGIRDRSQRVYECGKCHESFYNGSLTLILMDGTQVAICAHCAAQLSAHRCVNCNNIYESEERADMCCGDRLHYSHKDVTMTIDTGTDFSRFSERPIGMEIETGEGGRKTSVFRWLNKNLPLWGATSDGSIPSSGYEYVSSPMSGDKIEKSYRGFATAMLSQEVQVEHQRAGYHVHVNAMDLYKLIGDLHRTSEAKADIAEIMLQDWGKAMIELSKEMVAPWRRTNHFCNGHFGYRSSKGSYPRFLRRATGSSYPALAIRMDTLEFRIFPSTANLEWHLTRTEVAQKSVDYLFTALQTLDTTQVAVLVDAIMNLRGAEKIDKVARLLNLSADSTFNLFKMHKTWMGGQYPDGKVVGDAYRHEPKPRKKRADAGRKRGPNARTLVSSDGTPIMEEEED